MYFFILFNNLTQMDVKIDESWKRHIGAEFDKPYFAALAAFVHDEYRRGTCYPPGKLIFNAFNLCPFDKVKVVIIGQDPYHEPGQAQGLCFSVNDGVPFPPSLVNIFKATLTVRAHAAGSHQRRGWEEFTDAVIKTLSADRDNLVFILWGSYAGGKAQLIDQSRHLILRSAHPSPLSAHRGFFGNHHFSLANQYLAQYGKEPIKW